MKDIETTNKLDNTFDGEVKENYIVSSLVRGLQILSAFTVKRPSLKVSEIAEMTGLDQATVFRFVYTLEKLGYLVREEESKRYHQGVKMLTLGLPARKGIAVREVALPVMIPMSKTVNEVVTLAILDGVDAVTVATAEILEKTVFSTPIGHRSPSYCTATGKILLANQPDDVLDRLISRIDFAPYTQQTIVNPARFREELLEARQRGYAIQDGELIANLGSIAAPIINYHKDIVAALNISGLSMHILHEEKTAFYIDEVLKNARAISAELGYRAG
jgi:DNA-binding IclR family transcriptional regulator